MPFTAAHPSLFIPLFRVRWLSATGLIAGSMSPDFENFMRMSTKDVHGHTIAGIFYFDLPVSLLIAFTFHHLLREPLTANLPGFLRRRLEDRWTVDFAGDFRHRWPVFLISCLLGAASHIGWDHLTHNGWAAQNFGFYRAWSLRIGDLDYPPFYVMQQVSTVLGTGALMFYILMLPSASKDRSGHSSWWFWPGALAVMVLMVRIRMDWEDLNYDRDFGDLMVSSVASMLTGLRLMAAVTRLLTKRGR